VFLDEIGEVEPTIQVKLLRVLQTREFQRLGETTPRHFPGKVIAVTNQDLGAAIRAGRFREDFYYRICGDVIPMPSLAERLRDTPGELRTLLQAIARRVAGDEAVDWLAETAERWITVHRGPDYPWPGHVRELEQCVRNLLIRGEYWPHGRAIGVASNGDPYAALVDELRRGTLTADGLVGRCCTLVYAETGSYAETARRLGLECRTVRDRVNQAFLEALRAERGGASGGDGTPADNGA
jgi:DNA-binding NtrC family response regulator